MTAKNEAPPQPDFTEEARQIEAKLPEQIECNCPYCADSKIVSRISPERRQALAEELAKNRVQIKFMQDDERKCAEPYKPFVRIIRVNEDDTIAVETVTEEDFPTQMIKLLAEVRDDVEQESAADMESKSKELDRVYEFMRKLLAPFLAKIAGYENPDAAFAEVKDEELPDTLETLVDNLPDEVRDPRRAIQEIVFSIATALRIERLGGKDGETYENIMATTEDPYEAIREIIKDVTKRAESMRTMLDTLRSHFGDVPLYKAVEKAKATKCRK